MGGVAREAMTEVNVTPEEMESRIARFADMVPYKDTMNAAHDIPPEAMQMMSSDKVFPLMCPADCAVTILKHSVSLVYESEVTVMVTRTTQSPFRHVII